MDELDHNLLMAWNRVFERCKTDPREARRRYDRMRAGGTLDRPHRAFCVALRASDTRLRRAARMEANCGFTSEAIQPSESCARLAQEIVVDGRALRELGGPVSIPYPGVALREAAGLLGRSEATVAAWLPVRVGKTVAQKRAVAAALACERCWKIKRSTFSNSTGWNELVSTLSGGLLFGREVERPSGFEYERRRAYAKRRTAGRGAADQSMAVKLSTSMK